MGCCSIRGNRQGLEEKSTNRRSYKNYRNDIYINPTKILNIRESSLDEKDINQENGINSKTRNEEYNEFSPIDANNEGYCSNESKGRFSYKDIISKRNNSSSSRNYSYINSKRLNTLENLKNKSNANGDSKLIGSNNKERNISSIENCNSEQNFQENSFYLKIKLKSLRLLNNKFYEIFDIDLQNEDYFNNNYCFILLVNLNNYIYFLQTIPNYKNTKKANNIINNKCNTFNLNISNKQSETNGNKGFDNENFLRKNILFENSKEFTNDSKYQSKTQNGSFNDFINEQKNGPFEYDNNPLKSKSNIDGGNLKKKINSFFNGNIEIDKDEKKIKNFENDSKNSFFFIENSEIEYNIQLNDDNNLNYYLSLHLFMSHKIIQENSILVGETFIPLDFLKVKVEFPDDIFEIPVFSKTDYINIAFLNLGFYTKETSEENTDLRHDLYPSKSNTINSSNNSIGTIKKTIDYFSKYQILKLNNYNQSILKKFGLLKQVNSLEITNLKIKFLDLLKKYAIDNKKREAILELSEILSEYPLNISLENTSFENNKNCKTENNNNKNNIDMEKNIKKILSKLDFKSISFPRYFAFLSVINEFLVDLNERTNLIVNSNFIYERLIFNPFTRCDEKLMKSRGFENMVVADLFFSILINLKKSSSDPINIPLKFDSYYCDCVFIFRDLGNFYLNAKYNLLCLIKENGHSGKPSNKKVILNKKFVRDSITNNLKFSPINNEKHFNHLKKNNNSQKEIFEEEDLILGDVDYNNCRGPNNYDFLIKYDQKVFPILEKKEDFFYYLNYNVVIKYLQILNNMLEIYIKALKDYPESKTLLIKVEGLIDNLKNNFEIYIIKKLDEISLKNLDLATNILNLILSFAKLGQSFSILRGYSRIECYISYIIDEYSAIFYWLQGAFKKFYFSNQFFKIFLGLGEIILVNSPLIFCNNFLRIFSLKQIYFKFTLDAKMLDSRKFPFWIAYLKFLFYIISNCSTDACKMADFFYINFDDFCKHICDIFMIIINYPYFKPFSSNFLSWEKKKNFIYNGYIIAMNNKSNNKFKNKYGDSIFLATEIGNSKINKNFNEKISNIQDTENYINTDCNNINNSLINNVINTKNDFSENFDSFQKRENLNFNKVESFCVNSNENGFDDIENIENYIKQGNFNLNALDPSIIIHFKKFLSSTQSILIISKFIDIFSEMLTRKYIFNILKIKHKIALDRFFDYVFFLIFYQINLPNLQEEHLNEVKIIYFSLFSKIIKIFYFVQESLKIDLNLLMIRSLKKLFKNNSNNGINKNSNFIINNNTLNLENIQKNIFADRLYEKIHFFKVEKKNENIDINKTDKNLIILEKLFRKMQK